METQTKPKQIGMLLWAVGAVALLIILMFMAGRYLQGNLVSVDSSPITLSSDQNNYVAYRGGMMPVIIQADGVSEENQLLGLKLTLSGVPNYITLEQSLVEPAPGSSVSRIIMNKVGGEYIIVAYDMRITQPGGLIRLNFKVSPNELPTQSARVRVFNEPGENAVLVSEIATKSTNGAYLSNTVNAGDLFTVLPSNFAPTSPTPTPAPTPTVPGWTPTPVIPPTATPIPTPSTNTVYFGGAFGNTYAPPTITIRTGDSVTWRGDFALHPMASDDTLWNKVTSGTSFSYTFNTAGEYKYYCTAHGGPDGVGMSGTIVVLPRTINFGGTLGNAYSPSLIMVRVGDSVEWRGDFNADPLESDGNLWNRVTSGTSFRYTFDTVGTHRYYSASHGGPGGEGMNGAVVVLPRTTPTPVTPTPTLTPGQTPTPTPGPTTPGQTPTPSIPATPTPSFIPIVTNKPTTEGEVYTTAGTGENRFVVQNVKAIGTDFSSVVAIQWSPVVTVKQVYYHIYRARYKNCGASQNDCYQTGDFRKVAITSDTVYAVDNTALPGQQYVYAVENRVENKRSLLSNLSAPIIVGNDVGEFREAGKICLPYSLSDGIRLGSGTWFSSDTGLISVGSGSTIRPVSSSNARGGIAFTTTQSGGVNITNVIFVAPRGDENCDGTVGAKDQNNVAVGWTK